MSRSTSLGPKHRLDSTRRWGEDLDVRRAFAILVGGVLTCCGGDVASEARGDGDAGHAAAQDGSTDGDVLAASPCFVTCENALGACPADCVAQCETYWASDDPCAKQRISFWACAARHGKAYCGGDLLTISVPESVAGECPAEVDAAKTCACQNGGLLCD